jgi:hypothetical protein
MGASIFGAAFDKLTPEIQKGIRDQLQIRKHIYLRALHRQYNGLTKAIVIGDTPGPGRPTTAGYHHTPFYSTKNSSLWLNKQLVEAGIEEEKLVWFNAELADGTTLDPVYVQDLMAGKPAIICLGGKAEMWVRRNAPTSEYVKVYHPQFAKRFKSKEPYALIDELKRAL